MDFKARTDKIKNLLQNKIFSIPRNQRRYVWTQSNWEDLFTDLEFSIKLNEEDKKKAGDGVNFEDKYHFLGSIVLESNGHIVNTNRYEIIDGQQRTVTILLFCSAIMALAKIKGYDNLYQGMVKYIREVDDDNEPHNRLESDFHIGFNGILDIVADLSEHPYNDGELIVKASILNQEQDKAIANCFLYFYNKMVTYDQERLLKMRNALLNSDYIEIVSENKEDSYTIFEILNARGQVLQDYELVKNYIMRYILPRDTVDDVKREWENIESVLGKSISQFFKHYATRKYGAVKKDQVFIKIRDNMPKGDAKIYMSDIIRNVLYYSRIIKPQYEDKDANCTMFEYRLFKRLKDFRAEQVRPILLCLIEAKEEGKITQKEYESALKFVHDFFMCYNVIGKLKSNKLQDSIDKYSTILDKSCTVDNINLFKENLLKKLPTYHQFETAFMELGWSNKNGYLNTPSNKKGVQMVLELIESYYRKNRDIFKIDSIEHIVADDDKENGNIGNLLPLEKNLNGNLGDKRWKDKLDTYAISSYKMTNAFAQRYQDREFDMVSRAKKMAELIYTKVFGFNKS